MKTIIRNFVPTILFFSFLFYACNKDDIKKNEINYSEKQNLKKPDTVTLKKGGGNLTCEQAASMHGLTGFEFSTGRIDYPFSQTSFGSNVIVETDGVSVSWKIIPPEGYCVSNAAVIVKGGPSANVYFYEYGTDSDAGLVSPINASGKPAALSNLTICYNLVVCEVAEECIWEEETAFAGGQRGTGNAWWFALDASNSGTYPIYAGQEPVEGASIIYDKANDLIKIELGSKLRLQNVNEPVKIEGYNILPSSRPAAGLFELYKGNNLEINGNGSLYYVVHLDVEVCRL